MSKERKESSILAYFADLPDPRLERCKHQQLLDIIVLGICAVICGADSFVELAEFGTAKREWFETFLALANGIPSHDTFRRVFGKPEAVGVESAVFFPGSSRCKSEQRARVIAIDGKALRGTFERTTNTLAISMGERPGNAEQPRAGTS